MDIRKIIDWFRVQSQAEVNMYGSESLTQMKLMKLLYYVQGVYLALYDEKAFDDDILAWDYGPVVYIVHDKFKGYRELPIRFDDEVLKGYKDVQNDYRMNIVVNSVNDAYRDVSAIGLMNQTHEEKPWIETYKNRNNNDVIDPELIKTYFKDNIVS